MRTNNQSESLKGVIHRLNPEYALIPLHQSRPELLQIVVPGKSAEAHWRALYEARTVTGYWPIVMGDDEEVACITPNLTYVMPAHKGAKDATEFFETRITEFTQNGFGSMEDIRGEWPSEASSDERFAVAHNILSGKPKPQVHIVFFPTLSFWDIPAILNYGGWNEYPMPADHSTVQQYWHKKYGAVTACLPRCN